MVSGHFLFSLGPSQGSPPPRSGAPRHGAPLGLWLRLAGLSAGWLACRLSAGFRLDFGWISALARLRLASGLIWLSFTRILVGFDLICLDLGLDFALSFAFIYFAARHRPRPCFSSAQTLENFTKINLNVINTIRCCKRIKK